MNSVKLICLAGVLVSHAPALSSAELYWHDFPSWNAKVDTPYHIEARANIENSLSSWYPGVSLYVFNSIGDKSAYDSEYYNYYSHRGELYAGFDDSNATPGTAILYIATLTADNGDYLTLYNSVDAFPEDEPWVWIETTASAAAGLNNTNNYSFPCYPSFEIPTTTIDVALRAIDTDENLAQIRAVVEDSFGNITRTPWQSIPTLEANESCTLTLKVGQNRIWAEAIDDQGNIGSSEPYGYVLTVTAPNTPPMLVIEQFPSVIFPGQEPVITGWMADIDEGASDAGALYFYAENDNQDYFGISDLKVMLPRPDLVTAYGRDDFLNAGFSLPMMFSDFDFPPSGRYTMVFMLLDSFEGVTEVRRSFTVGSLGDINPETGNIYGLEIDSNNNGVKDLIEQSLGLNPLGDNDADPRIQALKDQAKEYQYNQVNELTQSPERGYQLDAEGNIEGK